ncbi:MAG: hypothetical protein PUC33_07000 [Oscillospiraceae bacterium]|nr:hypothetical protein [Oscillospiraceae bacterium]MDD6145854.1 hypothetical protein [Oscillospiraceae bacterium]
MKKTFKKVLSLILVVMMLMSVTAVAFSSFASAEDVTATTVSDDNLADDEIPDEGEAGPHKSFIQLFIEFFKEIGSFLKYIFYDIFLGKMP